MRTHLFAFSSNMSPLRHSHPALHGRVQAVGWFVHVIGFCGQVIQSTYTWPGMLHTSWAGQFSLSTHTPVLTSKTFPSGQSHPDLQIAGQGVYGESLHVIGRLPQLKQSAYTIPGGHIAEKYRNENKFWSSQYSMCSVIYIRLRCVVCYKYP